MSRAYALNVCFAAHPEKTCSNGAGLFHGNPQGLAKIPPAILYRFAITHAVRGSPRAVVKRIADNPVAPRVHAGDDGVVIRKGAGGKRRNKSFGTEAAGCESLQGRAMTTCKIIVAKAIERKHYHWHLSALTGAPRCFIGGEI